MIDIFHSDIYTTFASLLEKSNKIVVVAHTSPDGDAVGSILGMVHWLKVMGKEATPILPDELPDYLHWLPGVERLLYGSCQYDQCEQHISSADLIICMDFNVLKRLGCLNELVSRQSQPKVLIDHHLDPAKDFAVAFSYPPASSTAELFYHVVTGMGGRPFLSKEAATCLMVGIITDTGCFHHNCSSPALYHAVADLLALGVDNTEIINRIYNQISPGRLRIEGFVLNEKLQVLPEIGTAYFTLTMEEMARYGMTGIDTDGLVNIPLRMKGIDCVCFFREDPDQVKLSLRSVGDFPVNQIASSCFNGGGHKNASGAEFKGSFEEAIERFLKEVKELRPNYPIV